MEGKKKYIAIILFLLIGLGVFTFANPDEELGTNNGSNNGGQQQVETDDNDDKTQDVLNEEEDNNNNNTGSNNNPSNVVTRNDAYAKALAAVQKLEQVLTEKQAETARDLVEEVTNSKQYADLIARVENAEDAMDATKLVEELEKMVEEAAARTDIENAATNRDDVVTPAIEKIEGENLEEVKEELTKRVEALAKILDDSTAPTVEPNVNGTTTNNDVTLVITDDNEFTATVTKDGQTYELKETFTEEGIYEVKVVDAAFNEDTITFTIDKTKPEFVGLPSREAHVDSYKIEVEDATEVTIKVKKDHASNWQETLEGTELTEEGTYQILAVDAAGNEIDTWVIIDKTNPTISGIEGSLVNKAQTILVEDRYLDTVEINGKKYTRADFTHNAKNEEHKFEITLSEDGVYTIVAKDRSGKETTATFEIDTVFKGIASANMYTSGKKYVIDEIPYYYATNGNTITAYIRTNEQLGKMPVFTFNVNGKDYKVENVKESFHKPEDKEAGIYKYEVTLQLNKDVEIEDGELTFTVSGIEDKATNKSPDRKGVTNKNVNIIDRTSNRLSETSIKTDIQNKENPKMYYAKNGTEITVYARFKELLGEDAILKIAGQEVKLEYSKEIKSQKLFEYKATVTIPVDEKDLAEGQLTFEIENVTDKAGNTGFYYKKATTLSPKLTAKETTASKFVVYDRTSNRVVETSISGDIKEGNTYYIKNGDSITFQIGFKELLNDTAVFKIGGRLVELGKPTYYAKEDKYVYRGTFTIDENEKDLQEGQLSFTIENVTDKAGNVGFYYLSNGKKVISTITTEATSNGRVLIYDRTSNRVVETSISGDIKEGNTYYIKNGDSITFQIGFKELLNDTAVFKIGGRLVELGKPTYYAKEDKYVYRGTFTIDENEKDLQEGQLSFTIENVTDKVGNVGFYYLSNGKKVISTITTEATSNGRVLIYDRTSNRLSETSIKTDIQDKENPKMYYAKNGTEITVYARFKELLGEDAILKIAGQEVKLEYSKEIKSQKLFEYKATVTIPVDEKDLAEGQLTFEIENVTDKAGNTGFYYKKATTLSPKLTAKETTASKFVVYDRTSNRVVETSISGDIKEGNTYYIKNGDSITFQIGFKELLNDTAVFKIGGRLVELGKPTYYAKEDKYVYRGTFAIDENEKDLQEGQLSFTIENVTDKAGNVGFYYLSNGKKVISTITTEATSNGKKVFYDITAPEVIASYTEDVIEEDSITEYTREPEFTITDNSGQPVTKELLKGKVNPSKLGTYELVYRFTDILGNYKDVTITVKVVDTQKASITDVENGVFYKTTVKPKVTDKNLKSATITQKVLGKELYTTKFLSGTPVFLYGEYTINAEDTSGNAASVTFVIDNVKPRVLLLDELEYIQSNIIPIKPVIIEEYLDTVTLTREYKDLLGISHIETIEIKTQKVVEDGRILTKVTDKDGNALTESGTYTLTAIDKAGNEEVAVFTIDNENPVIVQNVLNGGIYKEFNINVLDANYNSNDVIVLRETKKINGLPVYERYELSSDNTIKEEGEYLVVVYDKAYNIGFTLVVIDRTKPTTNIEPNKVYKEVTPTVEDANLDTNRIELRRNNKKIDFALGDLLTEDGEYKLLAYDKAKNELEIYFTIDAKGPVITKPSIPTKLGATTEPLDVTAKALDNVEGELTVIPTVEMIFEGVTTTLNQIDKLDISTPGAKYVLTYKTTDKVGNESNTVVVEFEVVPISYEYKYTGATSNIYNGKDNLSSIKSGLVFNEVSGLTTTKLYGNNDAELTYTITKGDKNVTEIKDAGTYNIKISTTYNEVEYTTEISYIVTKAMLEVKYADLEYGDTITDLYTKVKLYNGKENVNITPVIGLYKYEDIYIPWITGQKYIGTFPKGVTTVGEGKYFYTVGVIPNSNYEIDDHITLDLYVTKEDLNSTSKSIDYIVTKPEEE